MHQARLVEPYASTFRLQSILVEIHAPMATLSKQTALYHNQTQLSQKLDNGKNKANRHGHLIG